MESLFSVSPNKCTLCFSCIRNCPVKAIDIDSKNEKAVISDERCIGCGICYKICPEDAIGYRKDFDKAVKALESDSTKIILCDPAIASEFEDISDYRKFVGMLKITGFDFAYETSFAIDLMAKKYKKLFKQSKGKLYISSYCSTVVEYVEKYTPEIIQNLAPIGSPMMLSVNLAKKIHPGENVDVFYITPCISVKNETQKYESTKQTIVLTFDEIRDLFVHYNISENIAESDDFDQPLGLKGLLYPINTGILDTLEMDDSVFDSPIMSIEGTKNIHDAFGTFIHDYTDINKHLNAFYCEGCIMGPGTTSKTNKYQRNSAVLKYSQKRLASIDKKHWEENISSHSDLNPVPVFVKNDQRRKPPSDKIVDDIIDTLHSNPHKSEGCGACGFTNCQELAEGIHMGYGHADMCLRRSLNSQKSYSKFMKQNDERIKMYKDEINTFRETIEKTNKSIEEKSETISRTINSLSVGVVFFTADMKIQEANKGLVNIIGEEAEMINDVIPGMKGADIRSLLPAAVSSTFEYAINNNESIHNKDITIGENKFILSVFNIVENQLAGAIFRSFHAREVKYEEFENRIIEAIDQNLTMVQNIGFLLGEGASNTERMLNSVIESFKAEKKK
ncbi:MAG: [Fe-Fe] hydrogenase large subunit C-terminal domain-containing protein [Bacteroidales bacterium]|nr:[Fe-Fe] hydrogenase large subunit C-terminal domain-containing protein [Bacteroidales bacterium]MDY0215706.1 [Fe-Fe] hydrogenase large subunit C-terminal domain-containing protein [Bacteroidales bacterium]